MKIFFLDTRTSGVINKKMINTADKRYPDEDECFRLINEYRMLPNIIQHSIQVRNVSVAIYKHLGGNTSVSLELIIAAALLHDIAKTDSIGNKEMRHDITGGEILRNLGYDDIADIVENHVVFTGFDPEGPVTEKEIIYYADKRVMHDRIVNIDTRVIDLVERYGGYERIKGLILENKKFVLALESKIQSRMDIDIDKALAGI